MNIALLIFFFFQAEDGIRDATVTGVQTCALPISAPGRSRRRQRLQQSPRTGVLDRRDTAAVPLKRRGASRQGPRRQHAWHLVGSAADAEVPRAQLALLRPS